MANYDIKTLSDRMANEWQREILFCAATAAGEARGEGRRGMQAVINVAVNRLKSPVNWWKREAGDGVPDDTLAAVCLDPKQFSCWNRGDANYKLCLQLADPARLWENMKRHEYFRQAIILAAQALDGDLLDITDGSTHYHAKSVKPYWVEGHTPALVLNSHSFYNTVT